MNLQPTAEQTCQVQAEPAIKLWRKGAAMKWWTIMYAIDGWGRTLRLCLIVLVATVPPVVVALLIRR